MGTIPKYALTPFGFSILHTSWYGFGINRTS